MHSFTATILANDVVAQDTHCIRFGAPGFIAAAGQFVHVRVPDAPHLLLRRPISVHTLSGDAFSLIVQRKGEGTARLCDGRAGDVLDMIGPLGNGFAPRPGDVHGLLVGGGIGVAPLLMLPLTHPDMTFEAILGFRSAAFAYALDDFTRACQHVTLMSDDGTLGARGLVGDPLAARLAAGGIDAVYACGPTPMLQTVQRLCQEAGVYAQLSLEAHMGCGVGGCVTCSCGIRAADGTLRYQRVCLDGPVFDASEVVFA